MENRIDDFYLRAIVVDDEPEITDIVCEALRALRVNSVVCARNGREALEICRVQSFDIIFTDIKMPEMNGVEFLEQALLFDSFSHTLVFIISGEQSIHEQVAAHETIQKRVSGIYPKPFLLKDLADAVKQARFKIGPKSPANYT